MPEFLDEVVLDGLLDTLKLLPFLFLTYLLMEYIEHRTSSKISGFFRKSGALGPLFGGLCGIVPQCGFSAAAANLYTGRVITLGTMLAVFLSTSDEMLPLMIAEGAPVGKMLLILSYKLLCALLVGFGADLFLRLTHHKKEEIDIDELCEQDNCHCEKGIFRSALHHTLSISVFIFIVFLAVGSLVFFVGTDTLAGAFGIPGLSHAAAALLGLVPSCAVSVALTTFYLKGLIGVGTLLAGLLPNAGVGLLVLLRFNRRPKENACIFLTVIAAGILFGLLADLIRLDTLF